MPAWRRPPFPVGCSSAPGTSHRTFELATYPPPPPRLVGADGAPTLFTITTRDSTSLPYPAHRTLTNEVAFNATPPLLKYYY